MLKQALTHNGLIAILRGVRPDEAGGIGQVLYQAGFRVIEVPLNSPDPYTSIRTLRDTLPADCLIGAGTVLTPEQVVQVKAAGGQVIVMPHSDAKVLRAAKAAGLYLSPGVATPTEAFAALAVRRQRDLHAAIKCLGLKLHGRLLGTSQNAVLAEHGEQLAGHEGVEMGDTAFHHLDPF